MDWSIKGGEKNGSPKAISNMSGDSKSVVFWRRWEIERGNPQQTIKHKYDMQEKSICSAHISE